MKKRWWFAFGGLFIMIISLSTFLLIDNGLLNFSSKDYMSNRNLSGIILPLRYEDISYNHTGFWPYGVQGGSHPHGHPGFDFEATVNKPIISVDDGKVTNVDEMTPYQEQSITISSGTFTDYEIYYTGSIQNIQVKEGDIVKQGDIIAYFGPLRDNEEVLTVGIIHFGVNKKNIDKGGTICPYEFMNPEAKQQLEEIFNKVNLNRGRDRYPSICIPCPEDGCY